MKNQALFSSKDKSKKLKCHLLQFLFSGLRLNNWPAKLVAQVHFLLEVEIISTINSQF